MKHWTTGIIATCAILFASCVSILANDPVYGGSVVVAISSDPGGLNPAITTQGGVHQICGSIFSGLVAHDFELNPVPDLAQRWDVSLETNLRVGDSKKLRLHRSASVDRCAK